MILKRNISGIVLLNKPLGMSSNKALQKVKRIFNAKKAGHTGSLDPLASGMLPICLGEATKFSGYLLSATKSYRVMSKLGQTSITGDEEGEKTKVTLPKINFDMVKNALQSFQGKSQQIPPMYSAIKHQGQPLYKLARKGKQIDREKRDIHIYSIHVSELKNDEIFFEVVCSKGTYIRTLVEDIGKKLNTGAYTKSLHRFGVGDFNENSMVTLDHLEGLSASELDGLILPMEIALSSMRSISVSDDEARALAFGQKTTCLTGKEGDIVKLIRGSGEFMGLGQLREEGVLAPKRLLQAYATGLSGNKL